MEFLLRKGILLNRLTMRELLLDNHMTLHLYDFSCACTFDEAPTFEYRNVWKSRYMDHLHLIGLPTNLLGMLRQAIEVNYITPSPTQTQWIRVKLAVRGVTSTS